MTTIYRIWSRDGTDYGAWQGADAEAAWAAMVADGGPGVDVEGEPTEGRPDDWVIEPMRCACPHCAAPASVQVEGEGYCDACADYSVDEGGSVLCAAHDIPDIDWEAIEVAPAGSGRPNRVEGRSADGRHWYAEDRGGWTVPVPTGDAR